jgi:hypothetical protein
MPPDDKVLVILPSGEPGVVDRSEAGKLVEAGARLADDKEIRAHGEQAAAELEEERQAPEALGPVRAAVEGGVAGVTLGGSRALLGAAGGDSYRSLIRQTQKERPIASYGGEIGGSILPALVTGGATSGTALGRALAATPAGAAAAAGRNIAARGGAGALAAGLAVEGGLVGAGSGVSELALSDDPVTVERVASVVGGSALFGAGAGVGAGFAAKGAAKALARGRDAIKNRVAGLASAGDDGASIADDVVAYSQTRAGAFHAVDAGGGSAPFSKAGGRLRHATDNPTGLARRPQQVLDSLERDAEALRNALPKAEAGLARLAAEDADIARRVTDAIASAKAPKVKLGSIDESLPDRYAKWAGRKLGKTASVEADDAARFLRTLGDDEAELVAKLGDAIADAGAQKVKLAKIAKKAPNRYATWTKRAMTKDEGKALLLDVDEARRFAAGLEAGELAAIRAPSTGAAEAALAANEALQAKIMASTGKGAGSSPVAELAQKGIGAVAGSLVGGPIGAIAGALGGPQLAGMLAGKLGGAGAEVAKRTVAAVDRIMSAAAAPARALGRAAPMATAKVLTSVRLGPEQEQPRRPAKSREERPEVAAFRARESELRGQIAAGPTGTPVVHQRAREQIAQQLAPVAQIDPLLADRIETNAVRRLEYLATKLPPRPDRSPFAGPDRWRPSDSAIRDFARSVRAADDPAGVIERVADGSVTSRDVEALREVYPELYSDVQRQIAERLPELREALPYRQRLLLGIFFGVPVDRSMEPNILAVLQGAMEGSEAAAQPEPTSSPSPQPQLGAISDSAESPTPAQERAG